MLCVHCTYSHIKHNLTILIEKIRADSSPIVMLPKLRLAWNEAELLTFDFSSGHLRKLDRLPLLFEKNCKTLCEKGIRWTIGFGRQQKIYSIVYQYMLQYTHTQSRM